MACGHFVSESFADVTKSMSVVESRFTDRRNMTIKNEVFVEGDSEGFDIVRQWNNGASVLCLGGVGD